MNCREGDIAIIIKSELSPECVGYILSVTGCQETEFGIGWTICDNANLISKGYLIILDECVIPIRDSDKQDEMLSIIKIKEKV